jgi:hypothetical protein
MNYNPFATAELAALMEGYASNYNAYNAPHPTIFSLFPDALSVILPHYQFPNETLFVLSLINKEAGLLSQPQYFIFKCNT